MEIRNNAEALKAFLGVTSSQSMKGPAVRNQDAEDLRAAFGGDQASLSGVGAAMQSAAGQDGVRMERVAAVQHALAAGTYSVAALKVADRIMDAMLSTGSSRKD